LRLKQDEKDTGLGNRIKGDPAKNAKGGARLLKALPMREWLLVILPLALVLYFLAFPDQLGSTVDWVQSTMNWAVAAI
jgi:hypothetical protein